VAAEVSPEHLVAAFTVAAAALLAAARLVYRRLAAPCLEQRGRRRGRG